MSHLLALLALVLAQPLHASVRRRRFFHADDYALNDDLPGLRLALLRRFVWIDLNFHVTREGYLVCTHWRYPLRNGWYDPLHRLPHTVPVDQMTLAEVTRLRHGRRPTARIRTAAQVLGRCKKLRLSVEFEAKDSPAFATSDAPWQRLRRLVDHLDLRLEVKSIVTLGRGWQRLERAKAAGFTTIALRATRAEAERHGQRYYRP